LVEATEAAEEEEGELSVLIRLATRFFGEGDTVLVAPDEVVAESLFFPSPRSA
jgi:hypothetical protein